MKITLITKRYELKPNTKTVYELINEETETINEQHLKNYENSVKEFRRMGGSETIERSYTCRGYLMTKLTSKNTDRSVKIVREFNFE